MKKILPALIALSICVSSLAQDRTIDRSILECRYLETVAVDTVSMRKVTDTLFLKVGENVSSFYSKDLYFTDSLSQTRQGLTRLRELMLEYSHSGRINDLTSNTSEYTYMNYPEGYTTVRAMMINTPVEFVEELERPAWYLSDSTRVICGYSCMMAQACFRGREWTAWYTPDIPINSGPWKLWGLPGLIMEAYDTAGHYTYTAVSISTEGCGDIVLFGMKKKYKKTTRLTYLRSEANADFLINEESRGVDGMEKLRSTKKYDSRERDYR